VVLVSVVVQVVLARCPFTQWEQYFGEKLFKIAISSVKLRFSAVGQMYF